jgi:hypothetical protein
MLTTARCTPRAERGNPELAGHGYRQRLERRGPCGAGRLGGDGGARHEAHAVEPPSIVVADPRVGLEPARHTRGCGRHLRQDPVVDGVVIGDGVQRHRPLGGLENPVARRPRESPVPAALAQGQQAPLPLAQLGEALRQHIRDPAREDHVVFQHEDVVQALPLGLRDDGAMG